MRLAPTSPEGAKPDTLWLLAAIVTYDPKVATAKAAIATAEARAAAERHVATPALTLTGEYANDPSTRSPWLIGGAVDLPLDSGGRRNARLRGADLEIAIARYDFAETVWAERHAAHEALIDALIAERRVALGEQLLALRDRQLAVMARRVKAGDASNTDATPVRLAREAAARDLAASRSAQLQAQQALAAIIGVPVTAIASIAWDWGDFDLLQPDTSEGVSTSDRLAAITGRADVLRALAAYDKADASYRGEIAKQFPAFTLSPGYTWERGLVKLPLSVGLALPPLDLNRHAITAAAQARDEAGKALEQAVAGATNAIDAAQSEEEQALAALVAIRQQDLAAASAGVQRADSQLRLGAIDRAEWTDAQISLIEAHLREIDALERAQRAALAREDAMRKPLGGPETRMTVSLLEVMQ